jgi:RHS repeat-associated protein
VYDYSRLTSVSTLQVQGTCTSAPSYSESYSYGAPGNVLSKTVTSSVAPWGSTPVSIDYSYDSYGRTVSVQYPFQGPQIKWVTFTTTYDSMGRPSGLTDSNGNTWVSSAGYDYAGRLQSLSYLGVTETRSYNTVGQLASIGWNNSNTGLPGFGNPVGTPTLTYTYSATQNNGQITQATDGLTGETTVYQYDALKRLTSASNSVWNETFGYDGFGNLTGKTLNGTLQSIPVNSATNQLSGPTYDLNGNMTVGAGATMAYNEDNRMSSAQESSGSVEYYFYTPDGKRFYRQMSNGDAQYTLYGIHGEALGTYGAAYTPTEMSVYFGGRRLWQGATYSSANGSQGAMFADRLGSNRYTGNYYPYGDAVGTAPQDQVGFATYMQDSYTGLDYADHRMYASTYGRFLTADPKGRKATKKRNPLSWNLYLYANDDPANNNDPTGLTCAPGSNGTIIDGDGAGCSFVGEPVSDWGIWNTAGSVPQVSSTVSFPPCAEPCGDAAINPYGAAIVTATGQLLSSISAGVFVFGPIAGPTDTTGAQANSSWVAQYDTNTGPSSSTLVELSVLNVTVAQEDPTNGDPPDNLTFVGLTPAESPVSAGALGSTQSGTFGYYGELFGYGIGGYVSLGGVGGGGGQASGPGGFDISSFDSAGFGGCGPAYCPNQ